MFPLFIHADRRPAARAPEGASHPAMEMPRSRYQRVATPRGRAADTAEYCARVRVRAPLAEFAARCAVKSTKESRPAGRCGLCRAMRGQVRTDARHANPCGVVGVVGNHDPLSERRFDVEEVIMRLASVQHGVVGRAQLLRAGVSPDVLDRRLKARRLRPVHRGVYMVGPLRAAHALEMAAVLACGASGVVSHRSAAALWQLLPRAGSGPVEVSTVRGDHDRRSGIRVHRARTLRADEVTKLEGIPITTPSRTLYDLVTVLPRRQLDRALAHAMGQGLTNRGELFSLLRRHLRHPGTSRLRALLASEVPMAPTRSEAEDRFLALIRKGQLSTPAVNVTVCGYEVDFSGRQSGLS